MGRPPHNRGNGNDAKQEKKCSPEFVSDRRKDAWYPAHNFGPKQGCTGKQKEVPERVSIPVYWVIAGTDWKRADIEARLKEAKSWFDKYCIKVPMYEVVLTQANQKDLNDKLAAALSDRARFRDTVVTMFKSIWKRRMSEPEKSLLLMFVDKFAEIEFTPGSGRIDSVSGNLWDVPVILMRSNDSEAAHIATHELIHGLGKRITKDRSNGFVGDPEVQNNTWGDGACAIDMGTPKRGAGAQGAFANKETDLLDWAGYYHMTVNEKNVT